MAMNCPWYPKEGGWLKSVFFYSNLLSNPYVCDCHLAWLGQWLKKTRVVSGNPRCQKPAFLKEIPIQDVAAPDFTCDGTQLYRYSTCLLCLVWWCTYSSAFILMSTHTSIHSFMNEPTIYIACTQVLRGHNPNHMAALNESVLAELSSAQSLWVTYTLLSITHVFLSSHASLIRKDRAFGHSSGPWITTHSISERFLHIRNTLDAVQDGYKSHTSPSQHGKGIGSANQTTGPLHYQALASF